MARRVVRRSSPPAVVTKVCRICDVEKLFGEFNKRNGGSKDGHRSECRSCESEGNKRRYHSDPEFRRRQIRLSAVRQRTPEGRETARWARLKSKFGLTKEQYIEKVSDQAGLCAICQNEVTDSLFCVDHDHTCCDGIGSCGECIRSLLCRRCNSALGLLNEDPELMRRMILYVEMWRDLKTPADLSLLEVK